MVYIISWRPSSRVHPLVSLYQKRSHKNGQQMMVTSWRFHGFKRERKKWGIEGNYGRKNRKRERGSRKRIKKI
jgi:hypothetical protein